MSGGARERAPAWARRRAVALGTAAAAGLACVRVETGPEVVAATRLVDTPPSVVRGDVLRDASGAVTPLAAAAYDEAGTPIPTAPLRFYYVPSLGDTTGGTSRDTALVVDSLTGAVSSNPNSARRQGVIAVRVGGGLQVLDTLEIVPRPDSMGVDTAVTLALRFSCADTTRPVAPVPLTQLTSRFDTLYAYNALGPFRVRVRGDSGGTRVNVRQRLVRWSVDSGPSLGAVRLPGGGPADTVPRIAIVTDAADRALSADTTDDGGLSSVRLRIRPFGLGRSVIAADTFTVRLRADAQPGPVRIAGGTQVVRVRLARDPRDATSNAPTCQ